MKSKIKLIIISVLFVITAIIVVDFAFFRIKATRQVKFDRETDETTDIIIIDDEDLKSVDDYSAKEVLGITLGKVTTTPRFEVKTTGNSVATVPILGDVNVKIANHRIVKDQEAFIECISAGMMSSGSQRFLSGDKVVLRTSSKVNEDATAEFNNDEVEIIDTNEYKTRYGWLPYQMNGYIFADSTYLEDPTVSKNEDNTYTIYVKLDPNSDAAVYYLREVATNAKATVEPEFTQIEFEITINNNFVVQKVKTLEKYSVTPGVFPIKTPTTTTCEDVYNYENISFDETLYNYYKGKLSA